MTMIADSQALAALCSRLSSAPYVTVDTEFMRERTFWPHLCLVQIAGPDEAVAVDPLAEGMDLSPLFDLMTDRSVLKVFHAARQDVEIFHHLSGKVPAPIFDTQVAAMVCGFGESASYETLAAKLARARIDKSSRFTDWARRPLSPRQVRYALADVTHLRVIYEKLARRLEDNGRTEWLAEEMATLTDPATYELHPEDAWRRLKTRSVNPRFLGILRELAAWREKEAQTRDIPRRRVIRDEALIEIAAHPPSTAAELERVRGLPARFASSPRGEAVLEAVRRGLALPEDALPQIERPQALPRGLAPLVDLLKVLLKARCEAHGVAHKLVASAADLERIALGGEAPVPALKGWRREIFGADALELVRGRLALAANGGKVRLVPLDPLAADA